MFWEVLTNEAIGILIQATLPGRVGMSKEKLRIEALSDRFVSGELLAVIRGQRMDSVGDRF